MQDKYEIFADNALLNIFNGALIPQLDKETNRLHHYRVIGYRIQNLETKTVVVTSKSPKDDKGVYSATIFLYGVRRKGTNGRSFFFPLHWTKDEVINAIFEAYQNRTLKNVEDRLYEGETSDNLKIKLWLDQAGKVTDAMPVRGKCLADTGEKVKKKRVCGICGKPKHTVCLNHHPFPKRRIFGKFRKKIRYYSRKIYFDLARKSGLID